MWFNQQNTTYIISIYGLYSLSLKKQKRKINLILKK